MMNPVLNPYIGRFCNVYVGDFITYSKSEKLHEEHLAHILAALSDAKLNVNFKKSEFFKTKVTFLRRVLDRTTTNMKE